MQNLHVPSIGDVIVLAEDWEFDLWPEDRNSTMMKLMIGEAYDSKKTSHSGWKRNSKGLFEKVEVHPFKVFLRKGSKLKIDRIYIRKGPKDVKEYDSVTFFLKDFRVPMKNSFYTKISEDRWVYEKKDRNTPVRFWAKLCDVNKIKFKEENE